MPENRSLDKQLPTRTREPPKTGSIEKSPRGKMKQSVKSSNEVSEADKKVINLKPLEKNGSAGKI